MDTKSDCASSPVEIDILHAAKRTLFLSRKPLALVVQHAHAEEARAL